jgi:hypothetical protein
MHFWNAAGLSGAFAQSLNADDRDHCCHALLELLLLLLLLQSANQCSLLFIHLRS